MKPDIVKFIINGRPINVDFNEPESIKANASLIPEIKKELEQVNTIENQQRLLKLHV